MNEKMLFHFLRHFQKYAYENNDAVATQPRPTDPPHLLRIKKHIGKNERNVFEIDLGRYQINPAENPEYSFLLYKEHTRDLRRYAALNAYLQGAIRETDGEYDVSFIDYQREVLHLLFGTYAFVDEENRKLHYLLGPSRNNLKQNFQFKTFYNIETYSGGNELVELKAEIMKLLFAINQQSREDVEQVDDADFHRIFNNSDYDQKRDITVEKRSNIIYISSGEADHCILQWAFLLREKLTQRSVSENIRIDFSPVFLSYEELFTENRQPLPFSNDNSMKPKKWLEEWGLICQNTGKPTERLYATMEWFYYYLRKYIDNRDKKATTDYYDFTHYLDWMGDGNHPKKYITEKNDPSQLRNFMDQFEGVAAYVYPAGRRAPVDDEAYINSVHQLIEAYLTIVLSYEESAAIFRQRCRFNPIVHFLFRNCISEFYWSKSNKRDAREAFPFKETTCRGLLFIPILNSPLETHDHQRPIGYFIGHIKDSDSRGHCFFNQFGRDGHRLTANTSTYFNERFYELSHVVNTLARVEREEIYVLGILAQNLEARRRLDEENRKNSFSLTTHCFKTDLRTTIMKKVDLLISQTKDPVMLVELKKLEEHCLDLYNFTGVISLIDKIGNRDQFLESGEKTGLLTTDAVVFSIREHYNEFSQLNGSNLAIDFIGAMTDAFTMPIYDRYLGKQLVKLFHYTLFENLTLHSWRDHNRIRLHVSHTGNTWKFENKTKTEAVKIDTARIKGNILLFKTLIEETQSGKLTITAKSNLFTLTYIQNS